MNRPNNALKNTQVTPLLTTSTWNPYPKPQNQPDSNSPKPILFTNQRKTSNSPKNIKLHLVTLFPVCLRLYPFSEFSSKTHNLSKSFQSQPIPLKLSPFSPSLIRGQRSDLILFVIRFNVTHIIISFSHSKSF
jgi:hypothetical protein